MSYKGWPRPPPVGCGIQRGIPDTAHGTANQRHSAAFFQASFCRLYRYVEFRMLSFAMNNRNSVESFCCLSCPVLKEFQRANFRRSWLLPLVLVWGHFSCMAQQPAAKPSTPRIDEKVLAELSERGKLVDVFVSHQGEMVWIEEYPNQTQAVLLNGKLMGAYYDQLKYVAESPDGKLWAFSARRKSRWVVVINGQERTGEYDDMAGSRHHE